MSARWTAADYARDASDLTAEATDAALGELYAGRDEAFWAALYAELVDARGREWWSGEAS